MCTHQVAFRSIRWNLLKPVHASDNWCFLSIHVPVISIFFSIITSRDVWVVLLTSMYIVVIGNVSSFGMCSLILGYNVIAINVFSCDRPEVTFSFLIITGWVFWRWDGAYHFIWISLKNFLFGKMKFPLLSGVNASFALSLLAWSSDASISSNSPMYATIMSPFQILPAYNT